MAKNIRGINKMIDAVYPGYSLIQEPGYVRLHGPDTHEWRSSSFPVFKVSQSTPEEWIVDVGEAIARKCGY